MERSNADQMLTVNQAAERLALSPLTMRAWIFQRRVGYVKLGRAVRIPEAEVNRLVDAATVPARSVA